MVSVAKTLLVLLISIIAAYVFTPDYKSPPRPVSLGLAKESAPDLSLEHDGKFPFGRYKKPAGPLDFSTAPGVKFTNLKQWHFHSINTEKYFVGMAVANLQYAATGFAYVVDKSNQQVFEYTQLSPLGMSVLEFNNTSIQGCTSWLNGADKLKSCFDSASNAWNIHIQATMTNTKDSSNKQLFDITSKVELEQSLALLYPITPSQPAYTHKAAGMRAISSISRSGESPLTDVVGLGVSDWTYSIAERVTRWKWASFTTFIPSHDGEPTRLGINLSDDVYVDKNGISQENGLWLNGQLVEVGKVNFILPTADRLGMDEWRLKTENIEDEVQFDLTFIPIGTREEHLNALVIVSDFVQPFGHFHGTITVKSNGVTKVYQIINVFGVMEKHLSKW